ncbi:MAG: serine/threonine protein kinase, partial [Gemmataceae bacterium]|nr:serine/threonine protein kinase [Gemmataceae bacterium]
MTRCPDQETLQGLLDDEPDDGGVSRHVAGCRACQAHLDALTQDGPEASLILAVPVAASTDSRASFLDRMKRSMPAAPSWAGREPRGGPSRRRLPTVPGFEVLRELGRGGMGVVYLARQEGLNRLVALKMLRYGSDGQARERFAQEAEALARLRHPGIVPVHGAGEADGAPYLVLEHVEGGSLGDRLHGDPIPAPEAARLVGTLARAVHHAHRQGIVHRDLKPSNVLLSDGHPKITDFGLAKRLDQPSTRTGHGDVVGTPSYMAPEQAGTEARDVGPATDV